MSFISSVACWICSVFCLYWHHTEGSLPFQWVMPLSHSSGFVRGNRFGALGLCIRYRVLSPCSLVISVTTRLQCCDKCGHSKWHFQPLPPHPYLSLASPTACPLSVRFPKAGNQNVHSQVTFSRFKLVPSNAYQLLLQAACSEPKFIHLVTWLTRLLQCLQSFYSGSFLLQSN